MTLHVEIVSTEQALFSGSAKFVSLPGEEGSLGILPGHAPIISRVKPGMVHIESENGESTYVFIAGGILEVQPTEVNVLVDTGVRADDLDEAKILAAKASVEQSIQNAGQSGDFDLAKAQAELAVSVAQLAAIAHLRKKRH